MMTRDQRRRLQLEAGELARAAWDTLRAACLREGGVEERALALAALEGAEREWQILGKMEVELACSGRVGLEIDSDGLGAGSAAVTGSGALEAANRPARGREDGLDEARLKIF